MPDAFMVSELLKEGIAAAKAGRKEEARRVLTQVVELDEHNEQGWLWLSGVVESLEDRRICLENVLAINPHNAPAQAGLQYLRQRAPAPAPPAAPAEDRCPRCQAPVSSSATTCPACDLPLIIACPACGQYAEVDRAVCPNCGQRLGDFRQGAAYHLALAQGYLDRRRLDRAQEALDRAKAEAPDDPQVLAGIAALHEETGRLDLAIAEYEQVLEHDPTAVASYIRLGALYRQTGKADQARATLEKAALLAGEEPENLLELARQYLAGGDAAEEAAALLGQVVQKQPMNVQAYLLLGDALFAQARHKLAFQHYEHACKLTTPTSELGMEARRKLSELQDAVQIQGSGGRIGAVPRGSSGSKTRPGCVTLYAVLTGIGGLFGAVGAIAVGALVSSGRGMFEQALQMDTPGLMFDAEAILAMLWVYVAGMVLVAAINLAIAIGLWNLKNWARIAVIVLQGLGLLGSLCQATTMIISLRKLATGLGAQGVPIFFIAWLLVGFVIQGYIIFWFVANREVFD